MPYLYAYPLNNSNKMYAIFALNKALNIGRSILLIKYIITFRYLNRLFGLFMIS